MFQLTKYTIAVPTSLDVYSCMTFEAFVGDFFCFPIISSRKIKHNYIKCGKEKTKKKTERLKREDLVFHFLWRFFFITLNVRCVNLLMKLEAQKTHNIFLSHNFSWKWRLLRSLWFLRCLMEFN